MALFSGGGAFFDPRNAPKKFVWVPFLRSFPGNWHINFFWGLRMGLFGWGAQACVEQVYVLFLSLIPMRQQKRWELEMHHSRLVGKPRDSWDSRRPKAVYTTPSMRTSWNTFPHFAFQALVSVIITMPITPNTTMASETWFCGLRPLV